MSMNRIFLASLLSGAMLLAACQAQPPADQVADAAAQGDAAAVAVDAPAAEPAAATGAEATDPLATELFNLVGDAVCGKTCPQYDARVDKAFSDMLNDAASLGDARLRERIGSGPQPQGERIQTAAGERWLYRACQAHQCNLTTLVALYDPATGRMAGRLVDKCQVYWLGTLPAEAMDRISELAPVQISDEDYTAFCTGN
jgi:predicted NBD/HSP70 family sugar kinase